MTTHQRGEVVWYPAVFEAYDRPFLIVSTDRHPYHGEEYIGLVVTTADRADAVPIEANAWLLGDLPKTSYIKPWNPVIIKDELVRSVAGVLHESLVDEAVAELVTVCRGSPAS